MSWTSREVNTSNFREHFIGHDSAKVKPGYSRNLETIHEKNEEESEPIREGNEDKADGGGDHY